MTPLQLSWWERQTYFENLDILIIGGGIVGLNAALSAKLIRPDLKILIVDRGPFLPYGASTRNAGFACFGSMTELLDDLTRMSHEEVFALVEKRFSGLMRLRTQLGDEAIGYEPFGGFEVFKREEESLYQSCSDAMAGFNEELKRIVGKEQVYTCCDEQIRHFGFSGVEHMILNSGEGQINSGRMMQSLLSKVRSAGVEVLTGIGITGWEPEGHLLRIATHLGFDFKVPKLIVTTNAFARELLPDLQVVPGRAQVIVTAPVPNLKLRGAFHYDKGYYYFRNIGDRILFGGGRNLDFKAEETFEFGLTTRVQQKLEELLSEMIIPGIPFEVEQRWSGIMGLGPVKSAIVKEVQPNVYCAVRMGGMGVAIGSHIGQEVAEMIVGVR